MLFQGENMVTSSHPACPPANAGRGSYQLLSLIHIEEVRLNHGEFSMLLLLASAPGQVFSKDQLYDAAWHEEYRYGTTAVENIIWRLRQKLEDDPRHPVYIKTVIRSGYKIEKPR